MGYVISTLQLVQSGALLLWVVNMKKGHGDSTQKLLEEIGFNLSHGALMRECCKKPYFGTEVYTHNIIYTIHSYGHLQRLMSYS